MIELHAGLERVGEGVHRLRHEEHLQLRHEAPDEADRNEEHRALNDERRRDLHAETEGIGDVARDRLRQIAGSSIPGTKMR
jgi:hypothetical protein